MVAGFILFIIVGSFHLRAFICISNFIRDKTSIITMIYFTISSNLSFIHFIIFPIFIKIVGFLPFKRFFYCPFAQICRLFFLL